MTVTFRGYGFHSLKLLFLLSVSMPAFSLCFYRCAHENLRADEPAWLTYSSREWGYSILYPAGWEAREAVERTGTGPFFEPDILSDEEVQKVTFVEGEYDMWPGQLQVKVLANPENLNLQQWAEAYRVEDISGGDLIQSRSDTTLAGHPAVEFSIFGFDQEIIAVVTENRSHFYYVTFSGASPNDPRQDTHRKIFAQMLSSFHFD